MVQFIAAVPFVFRPPTRFPTAYPTQVPTALPTDFTISMPSESGLCMNGILDSNGFTCCASSCGACGGCGCASFGDSAMGGPIYCCPGTILGSDLLCAVSMDVGCIMPGAAFPMPHELETSDGCDE